MIIFRVVWVILCMYLYIRYVEPIILRETSSDRSDE